MEFKIFAVLLASSATIWQNDTQTNQTFFMDATYKSTTYPESIELAFQTGAYVSYPFFHNFTINNRTFVTPATLQYRFEQPVWISGELRSNIFYGPIQTIQLETKGIFLRSTESAQLFLNETVINYGIHMKN